MLTLCLTPHTYESVLDEAFGIENSIIRVAKSLLGKSAQKTKTKTVQLNINYKQIRDTSFRYLGKLLSHKKLYNRDMMIDIKQRRVRNLMRVLIKKFKAYHADHSLVEQPVHFDELYMKLYLQKNEMEA
eukprot:392741_1